MRCDRTLDALPTSPRPPRPFPKISIFLKCCPAPRGAYFFLNFRRSSISKRMRKHWTRPLQAVCGPKTQKLSPRTTPPMHVRLRVCLSGLSVLSVCLVYRSQVGFQGPRTLRHYVFRCASESHVGTEKLRVGLREAASRRQGSRKDRIVQIAASPS